MRSAFICAPGPGVEVLERFALHDDRVGPLGEIASTASSCAMQRLRIARTNARSLVSHSFHHPLRAEKLAATKISFTGVKCRIHG